MGQICRLALCGIVLALLPTTATGQARLPLMPISRTSPPAPTLMLNNSSTWSTLKAIDQSSGKLAPSGDCYLAFSLPEKQFGNYRNTSGAMCSN